MPATLMRSPIGIWNARRIELAAEAESQRVAAAPAAAPEHAEIESGRVRDLEDARDRRRRRDPWYDLREENHPGSNND